MIRVFHSQLEILKAMSLLLFSCGLLLAAPPETSDSSDGATNSTERIRAKIPAGPEVFGVFQGRTPCQEISQLMNSPKGAACNKIKWLLVLYQDPITHAPTTYTIGIFHPLRTGKWKITKGTRTDPNASLYELETQDAGGFLALLKGDDNVLFFADKEGNPLVGNGHHSYTLNRRPDD